ncbi:MAG: helix-turn-helix domain-containing protein [Sneathiella sp.]
MLETFGDKWTLLIVRDLMFKQKRTYGEFLQSDEKISTNILADRLNKLEEHEIVTKADDKDNRSKRIYSLTEKGKDLLPIMLEMTAWRAKHDAVTNTPAAFSEMLSSSKPDLTAMLRRQMDD